MTGKMGELPPATYYERFIQDSFRNPPIEQILDAGQLRQLRGNPLEEKILLAQNEAQGSADNNTFYVKNEKNKIQNFQVKDDYNRPSFNVSVEYLSSEIVPKGHVNRYNINFRCTNGKYEIIGVSHKGRKSGKKKEIPMDKFIARRDKPIFYAGNDFLIDNEGVGTTCPPDLITWDYRVKNDKNNIIKVKITFEIE